jgi:large subunit ribosomal protein L4
MARVDIYRQNGQTASEIELNAELFQARVNQRLLEDVVRMFGQNKRTGLAHTKTRGEVRGGGKKPWKQKGTGRARHSSIRSPIWKGGGTTFGPRKHEVYYRIPEELRRQALISALSLRNHEKHLMVIENFKLNEPKTKEFFKILQALKIEEKNLLCVVNAKDQNVLRATQNIENVYLKDATELNAYHVMKRPRILIETAAITALEKRLLGLEGQTAVAMAAKKIEKAAARKTTKTAKKKTAKPVVKKTAKKSTKKETVKA